MHAQSFFKKDQDFELTTTFFQINTLNACFKRDPRHRK